MKKFLEFIKGIILESQSSDPSDNVEGSLWFNSTAKKFKAYADSAVRAVLTEDQAQEVTNKTIVVADNTITTAASGNLAATELDAALAELQTDIDTRALDSDLTAHTSDAVDAHDASAISWDNSSYLGSTNVQDAINENAEDITNHIANVSDAHDASAISFDNTDSSLVATDVQEAIDEVEARVDAADTHIADTANPHTTTLEQARTSDNVIEGEVIMTSAATPSAPASGQLTYFTKDTNGFTEFGVIDTNGLERTLGKESIQIMRNQSGFIIPRGSAVYVSGQTGNQPEIDVANADSLSTLPAIGITLQSASDGDFVPVMAVGTIESITTSSWNAGDVLYVSPDTAGALTATRPTHPDIAQVVGKVLVSGVGNGSIIVNVDPHTEGQESGTVRNDFAIGDATTTLKKLGFGTSATPPYVGYNPTTSRVVFSHDGSTEEEVGSGSGGGSGTNFIENGQFETDIEGWSTYNDFNEDTVASGDSPVDTVGDGINAAAHGFSTGDEVVYTTDGTVIGGLTDGGTYYLEAVSADFFALYATRAEALQGTGVATPVDLTDQGVGNHTFTRTLQDGTGGTALSLNLVRVTGDPVGGLNGRIAGDGSLQLSKDSISQEGRGLSTDFTIDFGDADTSKFQLVRFKYRTSSNYASGDIVAWIYDVDAGALVGKVINDDEGAIRANTTLGNFMGGFTPTTGNTNYRLIFHIATTNATPYSIVLDNVSVGPDSPTPTLTENSVEIDLAGSGDFTAGTLLVNKIGKKVTLTISGLTFSSSATPTSAAVLPEWAIPETTMFDTVFNASNRLVRLGIDTNGIIYVEIRDYGGSPLATTSENPMSITYLVAESSDNVLSSTEVLLKNATFNGILESIQLMASTTETINFTATVDNLNGYVEGSSWHYIIPKTGNYLVIGDMTHNGNNMGTAGEQTQLKLMVDTGSGFVEEKRVVYEVEGGIGTPFQNLTLPYFKTFNKGDKLRFDLTASDTNITIQAGASFVVLAWPEFSTFGGYRVVEYLAAESDEFDGGTAGFASGEWAAMAGNSVTLTPGTWMLNGSSRATSSGGSPGYTGVWAKWSSGNGDNTTTKPGNLTLDAGDAEGSYDSPAGSVYVQANAVRITVTENTDVYLTTRIAATTVANARVTNYIYAERIQ